MNLTDPRMATQMDLQGGLSWPKIAASSLGPVNMSRCQRATGLLLFTEGIHSKRKKKFRATCAAVVTSERQKWLVLI